MCRPRTSPRRSRDVSAQCRRTRRCGRRPTPTDMTVAAEQQVLVKVNLVERGKELDQVVANVRHRERHPQPTYPSQTVESEPTQIPLDVTTVQRGDRLTNQARFDVAAHRAIAQALHSVDTRPLCG